ncbi:hypothetical protein D041_0581B, partial [Vibrio parahaemolyticus EKP-008]
LASHVHFETYFLY